MIVLTGRATYLASHLVFVCVSLGVGILWSESVLADDGNQPPDVSKDGPTDNVRVLADFETRSFSNYGNCDRMHRPARVLAERIGEYVTGKKLPPPSLPRTEAPLSSTGPAVAGGDARSAPAPAPAPVPPPMFELFPIAWSLKTVNLESSFLPQLREEVIVLAHYAPEYFPDGAFANGKWVLAYLRNNLRPHESDVPEKRYHPFDSVGCWEISRSPELDHPEKPRSSRVRYRPNARCFEDRPTVEQISEWIYSTDFGNNDIHAHIAQSHLMDVRVVTIVVYPEYSGLAKCLRHGLRPETIAERKAAYEESFRRATIGTRFPRK